VQQSTAASSASVGDQLAAGGGGARQLQTYANTPVTPIGATRTVTNPDGSPFSQSDMPQPRASWQAWGDSGLGPFLQAQNLRNRSNPDLSATSTRCIDPSAFLDPHSDAPSTKCIDSKSLSDPKTKNSTHNYEHVYKKPRILKENNIKHLILKFENKVDVPGNNIHIDTIQLSRASTSKVSTTQPPTQDINTNQSTSIHQNQTTQLTPKATSPHQNQLTHTYNKSQLLKHKKNHQDQHQHNTNHNKTKLKTIKISNHTIHRYNKIKHSTSQLQLIHNKEEKNEYK